MCVNSQRWVGDGSIHLFDSSVSGSTLWVNRRTYHSAEARAVFGPDRVLQAGTHTSVHSSTFY